MSDNTRRKLRLITNSVVNCFRSCPKKHFYRNVQLRRPETDSEALNIGTYVHRELEAFWTGQAIVLGSILPLEDPYAHYKCVAMVEGYRERYPRDQWDFEVLDVEKQFQVPLINPETGHKSQTWVLGGKIDAVIRKDGKLYIVEHKTSASDIEQGSEYWQKLRLDAQIATYMAAAEIIYGEKCHGCLYDVLGKPRSKPMLATPIESRKYTKAGALYKQQRDVDETPEQYLNRIRLHIAENPEKYYQRAIIHRTEEDAMDSAFDLWNTAKMIRECEKHNRWSRNPSACYQWYSACEYFKACTGDVDINNDLYFRTATAEHEELA